MSTWDSEIEDEKLYKLWDEFLISWPVARVREMTLDEYSKAGDFDTFCAWIENKLDKSGSIWGGSAFKFGVYGRKDTTVKESTKRYAWSADYAWDRRYGESEDEAFQNVKTEVLKVIEATEVGDLKRIDEVNLAPVVKWKIASVYQNRVQPLLPCVFKADHLCAFLGEPYEQQLLSDLYPRVMKQFEGDDILAFSQHVWNEGEEALDINMVTPAGVEEESSKFKNEVEMQPQQPLNQILYGPPGTGKTFNTVNKALEILDPEFYQTNRADRPRLTSRFRQLQKEGSIGFVTFHQSFSYEDFVEGLKADVVDGQVRYFVEDGIFKVMCEEVQLETSIESAPVVDIEGKTIWKMSLGNTLGDDSHIYDQCIEAGEIRLGYGGALDFTESDSQEKVVENLRRKYTDLQEQDYNITAVNIFRNKMAVGDLVIITDGNRKFRAIAEIASDYEYLPDDELGEYVQTRRVSWIRVYEKSLSHEQIMNKLFSQMTIYRLKPKAINHEKLRALLGGSSSADMHPKLVVGQQIGDRGHTLVSMSEELMRVRSQSTDSVISFDMETIDELTRYVKTDALSIEDIAKKRVFEKVESKLEKYVVNGYAGVIAKIVDALMAAEPSQQSSDVNPAPTKNRVLIIDEINRGNISAIFGELITLIEPSKRASAAEELSVTLPYSKEIFRVPRNLHIVGTMNTADRSLALMDTALRRRFDFVEMMPDPVELEGLVVKGVNIKTMLERINERIEVLYDREHTLGHAFFMPLIDVASEDEQFEVLQNIFANKVLPLLEEYFFEDWEKIRLVLGDSEKPTNNQFIRVKEEFDIQKLFGSIDDSRLIDEDAKVYERHAGPMEPLAYQQIYEI